MCFIRTKYHSMVSLNCVGNVATFVRKWNGKETLLTVSLGFENVVVSYSYTLNIIIYFLK